MPKNSSGDTNIKNRKKLGRDSRAASRGAARGSASFWRAYAEQVRNDVVADGQVECSEVATAARQMVSERW